jgi:hypothetical protein
MMPLADKSEKKPSDASGWNAWHRRLNDGTRERQDAGRAVSLS